MEVEERIGGINDDGKERKEYIYIFKKFEIWDKLGLLKELKEPGWLAHGQRKEQ